MTNVQAFNVPRVDKNMVMWVELLNELKVRERMGVKNKPMHLLNQLRINHKYLPRSKPGPGGSQHSIYVWRQEATKKLEDFLRSYKPKKKRVDTPIPEQPVKAEAPIKKLSRIYAKTFNADSGRFKIGWDDKRVAQITGVSVDDAINFRKEFFGVLRHDPILKELSGIKQQIKDLLETVETLEQLVNESEESDSDPS